jgi:hypothetical protein
MSDPKPAIAKPSGDTPAGTDYTILFFVTKVLAVIALIFVSVGIISSDVQNAQTFIFILNIFQIITSFIILFCIYKVAIFMYRFAGINRKLGEDYGTKYKPVNKSDKMHEGGIYTKRLGKVKEHIYSDSQSEWKLAIIEMDGMLRDVLKDNGYAAETVAEQLKLAGERPFGSIENAWEAHKIRNKIAHEGIAFTIDEREAKRVFRLYSSVFEEFKVI